MQDQVLSRVDYSGFVQLDQFKVPYEFGTCRGELFTFQAIPPTYWRNYLHAHSFYEICYAFAGKGVFYVEGEAYPVAAGDVFIARPRIEHEIISDEKDALGIYFWSFSIEEVPDVEEDELAQLARQFEQSDMLVSNQCERLVEVLNLLRLEGEAIRQGFQTNFELLTRMLLIETWRSTIAEKSLKAWPNAKQSRSQAMANRMLRYLEDNYMRDMEVAEVAAQINVSPRHAARLFKQAIGLSIVDQLQRIRLDRAAGLMKNPELSIKQVALKCGYNNVPYFHRQFKQRYGQSPGEYRGENGE